MTQAYEFEQLPVIRLLIKLSLPMAIGMIINSLYTLVDAMFIARFIGEKAFASVSTVFPLQIGFVALAIMISNGASVLLSQALGKNDTSRVQSIIHSACLLILSFSLMIILLTLCSSQGLMNWLNIPLLLQADATTYFQIMAIGAVFVFSLSLFCDVLRSLGKMKYLITVITVGAVTNILADYLFIVVFGWGVAGAALASLFAHLISLCLGLWFLYKTQFLFYFGLKYGNKITDILKTGLPAFTVYIGGALIILICNYNIATYSLEYSASVLAAYGIIGRLNIFIGLPIIAITNACQTTAAYNYGAGHKGRVIESIKYGLYLAVGYLTFISFCLFTFTDNIVALFHKDTQVLTASSDIIRTVFLFLPLAAVTSIFVASMQATGQAGKALLISICKIYVLLLPLLFITPKLGHFELLWNVFPMVELFMFCAILFLFLSRKEHQVFENNLETA